jgi:hypothetical protein
LCITTNGYVKKNGAAVMGAGVAKEAKERFPNIDIVLGKRITQFGNYVHFLKPVGRTKKGTPVELYSFPTKHYWYDSSCLKLIESSAEQLVSLYNKALDDGNKPLIVLPRPGCGNGRLDWESQVKPILKPILEKPNFIVISR